MENAMEQRAAALFTNLPCLYMHPDDMPVPVELAEFKVRNRMVFDCFQRFFHDHCRILGIRKLRRVTLNQLAVFLCGIAGKLRHAV